MIMGTTHAACYIHISMKTSTMSTLQWCKHNVFFIIIELFSRVIMLLFLLRVQIHFDGWSHVYDEWVDSDNPDIHPADWCEGTGHALKAPPCQSSSEPPGNLITSLCGSIWLLQTPHKLLIIWNCSGFHRMMCCFLFKVCDLLIKLLKVKVMSSLVFCMRSFSVLFFLFSSFVLSVPKCVYGAVGVPKCVYGAVGVPKCVYMVLSVFLNVSMVLSVFLNVSMVLWCS